MRRVLSACVAVGLLAGCSYVLPATWRDFRADPDDAVPAITKALDDRQYRVAAWDQQNDEVRTEWILFQDALLQTRERYRVWWSRNEDDQTLTVYVRHEAQEKDNGPEGGDWGTTYHLSEKEQSLLQAITDEIVAAYSEVQQLPPPPPEAAL